MNQFIRQVESTSDLTFHSDDTSYAIFGTNCHTFYHALGDFVAVHASPNTPFKETLAIGPYGCTGGFTMGLYKRLALKSNYSMDLLKEFDKLCRPGERHQCSHEIGHNLHDKYVSSVLKVLDEISATKYGLKPDQTYRYVTFDKADLNAPFEDCKKIVSTDELPYCYTGVGHNLFLFSEFSPNGTQAQLDNCSKIAKENIDNCYAYFVFRVGINDGGPKFLAGNYEAGNKICNQSTDYIKRSDLNYHCFLGIGGGIGLFIESEYPDYKLLENDSRVKAKEAITIFAKSCEKAPTEFINDCIRGLLGTRVKDKYKSLEIHIDSIDKVLPQIKGEPNQGGNDSGFEVVG